MTTDRSLPAGYARCNTRDYHSKSAAYAGGFQRGWTAALARGFEEEQRSAGLAAVVEKVRGVIGAEVGWESPAILIDRIQWALSTAPADALAEHDARLIEGLADDMEGGFNRETLNLERRQIKRWLRERARQLREGEA